jgi:hypothetical protein
MAKKKKRYGKVKERGKKDPALSVDVCIYLCESVCEPRKQLRGRRVTEKPLVFARQA